MPLDSVFDNYTLILFPILSLILLIPRTMQSLAYARYHVVVNCLLVLHLAEANLSLTALIVTVPHVSIN